MDALTSGRWGQREAESALPLTHPNARAGDGIIPIEQAQRQEYAKQWGQLVARAWGDEAFKQRLLAEPGAALAEQGIRLPPGVEVRVHETTATLVHLTLPPSPAEELSDEQLDAVAGGDIVNPSGCYTMSCPVGCANGSVNSFASH